MPLKCTCKIIHMKKATLCSMCFTTVTKLLKEQRVKKNEFLKQLPFHSFTVSLHRKCEQAQDKWLFINYPTIPKPSGKVLRDNKEGRVMFCFGQT